jgi:capsular polysaccharide biosynthesis protein
MRLALRRGPRPSDLPVVESVEAYVTEELGEPGRFRAIAPAEAIRRRPPRHHAGELHPGLARLDTHTHPPTFCARLPGARVVGREPIVLTRDGRGVLQSAFDRFQLEHNRAFGRRLPRPREVEGERLLLANQWARTHFHWMLDTLPRLALLPADSDAPLLVPPDLSPAARESLRMVGIADERVEPLDHPHVVAGELVMPSLVGGTGNPPEWAVRWLAERLAPEPGPARRRIYVSRSDADRGRVTNEDEVVAALAEHGFEVLVASALPLVEQLRAFAEAEVIVGPHGAGLTGLFAARDATVIELLDDDYVNGCYYALADAAGLDYWYLAVPSAGGRLDVPLAPLRATLAAAGVA